MIKHSIVKKIFIEVDELPFAECDLNGYLVGTNIFVCMIWFHNGQFLGGNPNYIGNANRIGRIRDRKMPKAECINPWFIIRFSKRKNTYKILERVESKAKAINLAIRYRNKFLLHRELEPLSTQGRYPSWPEKLKE